MLKQRGPAPAEPVPRKKLSFREPEVESPTRNGATGPTSAPPLYSPARMQTHRHNLGRPHSVAGVVGLGGFSSLGGVPGIQGSTNVTTSVSGVTSIPILTPPSSPTRITSASHNQRNFSKSPKPQSYDHEQTKPTRPQSLHLSENPGRNSPKGEKSTGTAKLKAITKAFIAVGAQKLDPEILVNGRPRTHSMSVKDEQQQVQSQSLENVDLEVK